MKFVDEVTVEVLGGNGGYGCSAMKREKYVPFGGPAGGDGGNGGSVQFRASERVHTLLDLHFRKVLRAPSGQHGRGKDQHGAKAEHLCVDVPIGTQVFGVDDGQLCADLHSSGSVYMVAQGGEGGRGNRHFVTPTNRAPRESEDGKPGEQRRVRLVLKLMADVGLVGFPNVGKSTLISALSKARPKIADYPFTTINPKLGVVTKDGREPFVMADIPGIIEGASGGAGLGLQFLKHIERTSLLLFVITLRVEDDADPVEDFRTLRKELLRFNPDLTERTFLVGFSQIDRPEAQQAFLSFRDALLGEYGIEVIPFSAVTGEGLDDLLKATRQCLESMSTRAEAQPTEAKNPLPV